MRDEQGENMSKVMKQRIVSEWTERFRPVADCVVFSYQGIPGERLRELRARLRQGGGRMQVLQNALAARAFREAGLSCLTDFIQGPSAIAFGEDAAGVAKTISAWLAEAGEEGKQVRILGGALARAPLAEAEVRSLSALPDKKTLLSQVLATAIAPAAQVASLVLATLTQIPYLAMAHIEKKEKEG